eukprot:403376760
MHIGIFSCVNQGIVRKKKYHNFDISFGVIFFDGKEHLFEKQNMKRFIDIKFQYYEFIYQVNENGNYMPTRRNYIDIPMSKCNLGRFKNDNESMREIGMHLGGWICPDYIDFDVIGQFHSSYRKSLKLTVIPCDNSTKGNLTNLQDIDVCASKENITTFLKTAVYQMAILKSYFDQDELKDNPIKHEINTFYLNLKEDIGFNQVINLKRQILTTKDHWLSPITENKNYEYFHFEHDYLTSGTVKTGLHDQLAVFIANHDEDTYIERRMLTLIDILATAGGFANIVLLITRYFGSMFIRELLKNTLIRKLSWVIDDPKSKFQRSSMSQIFGSMKFQTSLQNTQSMNVQQSPAQQNDDQTLKIAANAFQK